MADQIPSDLTVLLERVARQEEGAMDALAARVYDELHGMAARHMRRAFGHELKGATLQPTALVNETFIRLIKQRQQYDNRGQFFAIATKLMLRVLVDYHRRRAAAKRGGAWVRVPFDAERDGAVPERSADIEDLAEALNELKELDSRKADVVTLRVLWGLTVQEVAAALGVGTTTVERDWRFARAWLAKELSKGES